MSNTHQQIQPSCVACHTPIRQDSRFCVNCGYDFHQQEPSSSEQTAPPQAMHSAKTSLHEKDNRWQLIKKISALFIVFPMSSLLQGLAFRKDNSLASLWLFSVIDAVIILVFAYTSRTEILALFHISKITPKAILKFSGIAFLGGVMLTAYFSALKYAGVPMLNIAETYNQSNPSIWSLFLVISIMPAFFEELAFRGIIQASLMKITSPKEALIIQAALFSVVHLSPIIFLSHFLMGLILGYLRLQFKNLYAGMLLHGIWNAWCIYKDVYN